MFPTLGVCAGHSSGFVFNQHVFYLEASGQDLDDESDFHPLMGDQLDHMAKTYRSSLST